MAPTFDERPKLLVSVRSPSETAQALAADVDIVDLKEPRHGALSPVSRDLWHHAVSALRRRQVSRNGGAGLRPVSAPMLSAALGERSEAIDVCGQVPQEFAFAKVGCSGCVSINDVRDLWNQVRRLLDSRVELVAVAYADFEQARCAHPEQIFRAAVEAGFRQCLLDTCSKDGRSTVDHLGLHGLRRLSDLARQGNVRWTLAGSIRAGDARELWANGVRPNCFGVRGDVCDQGRTGTLSAARVDRLKELLANDLPVRFDKVGREWALIGDRRSGT